MSNDEQTLDSEQAWRREAQAVIDDVKVGVREIVISESLRSRNSRILLNVRTLEDETFCIELTAKGFRVVGNAYDVEDVNSETYYETPYSLLDCRSPMFREAFSKSLADKLCALFEDRDEKPSS